MTNPDDARTFDPDRTFEPLTRLYDLGDAGGHRFLTMEYVDGEDLSSSLRRFGRMPPDKAVQIALNSGQILTGNRVDRFNVVAFTMLFTVVTHRYGLIAAAALLFVDNVMSDTPLTTDLSAWWSTPTVLTVGLVLGLLAFVYRAARGAEPLFGQVLPE